MTHPAPAAPAADTRLSVAVDLEHGARWTSLRCGTREWLWRRPAPERLAVRPGDPFVDAGGQEECIPTVRGTPDHGDVWCRAWRPASAGWHAVGADGFELRRRVVVDNRALTVDYRLEAPSGYRFVWAAHLLLDVSESAMLRMPAGAPVRVFAADETWTERPWPDAGGRRLDRLGPDDGSAVSAIVRTPSAIVLDGADRLQLRVLHGHGPDQPRSIGLWRNLRGWPAPRPYRSVGVEPMLGAVWDRAAGGPGDVAVVGPSGRAEWRMELRAGRDADSAAR